MIFINWKSLLSISLLACANAGIAQNAITSEIQTLLKTDPKIMGFVLDTKIQMCQAEVMNQEFAEKGIGSSKEEARRSAAACFENAKTKVRGSLKSALAAVGDNAKMGNSLKTLYLKWESYLLAQVPEYGPDFGSPTHNRRLQIASKEYSDIKRELLLDIDLGI